MKILFISNGFPPRHWAGTETYTAGLAKELHKRGHQVQVLCIGDWEAGSAYWNGYSDETFHDVSVRRLHLNWALAPHPVRYLYDNPVTASYLVAYLRELQPDLVHVTSCDTLSASVLNVVKGADLPLILSLTDFWFLCPRWNLLRSDGENCTGDTTAWDCLKCLMHNEKVYRWPSAVLAEPLVAQMLSTLSKNPILARQRGMRGMAGDMSERKRFLRHALALADYRITASEFVRHVFVRNGIEVPIDVKPYGHDLSWLDGYGGKTPSDTLRIGFIGQITYSKGAHLLLQAVRSLNQDLPDLPFEVFIYGDTSHNREYSADLFELSVGLPSVQFCGTYPHDESARIFASLDVLVVPSLWYDFPLVIYEAFATGTPVVATNLGGMAEAVHHQYNGLLFERANIADLAHQLGRLLDEPGLMHQLRRGIGAVRTIQDEIDDLEDIYDKIIGKGRRQI